MAGFTVDGCGYGFGGETGTRGRDLPSERTHHGHVKIAPSEIGRPFNQCRLPSSSIDNAFEAGGTDELAQIGLGEGAAVHGRKPHATH